MSSVKEIRRKSTRQAERRERAISQTKNAGPDWITPKTGPEGKKCFKLRIDSFFDTPGHKDKHAKVYKEYQTINKKHNTPYNSLMEIAIDRLRLKSAKRVENYIILQNHQKVQFLEPYTPSIDAADDDSWENVSSNKSTEATTKETEEEDGSVSSHESRMDPKDKILKYCETIDQGPLKYNTTIQEATDGTTIYVTVICHDKDEKIYGVGSALLEEDSKTLAAQEAVEMLEKSLKENDMDDEEIKQDETHSESPEQHTSDNGTETAPNDSPSNCTDEQANATEERLISTNSDEILRVLTVNFDNLFQTSISSMTMSLENIIKPLVQSSVSEIMKKEVNT